MMFLTVRYFFLSYFHFKQMACGDATCFPNFYPQLSNLSVFLSLSFKPNCDSFENFKEFMLAPHQKTNCTLTDYMFHVLIIDDQLFHNFPKNIPLREFFINPLIVF